MTDLHAAIAGRLAAAPERRGLRKRRPPVTVVVFVTPLPGDEARLAAALRERSKAVDVVGVLGDAAVAVLLAGADEAGARAYVMRVHRDLPVTVIAGTATSDDDTPDADALLRAAWPAGGP